MQRVQPVVAQRKIENGLRSGPLAGVSEVGIDHSVGVDHVAHAHADILDEAMPRARLAAVEGAAARRSQFLRIECLERLDAVLAEDLRIVIRNVGDLGIVAGLVGGSRGRTKVILGHEVIDLSWQSACRSWPRSGPNWRS